MSLNLIEKCIYYLMMLFLFSIHWLSTPQHRPVVTTIEYSNYANCDTHQFAKRNPNRFVMYRSTIMIVQLF